MNLFVLFQRSTQTKFERLGFMAILYSFILKYYIHVTQMSKLIKRSQQFDDEV